MKEKMFMIRMSQRDFRVRAYINSKTGRVLRVTAGCRTWKDFTEAVAHYSGGGRYAKYINHRWRGLNIWSDNMPMRLAQYDTLLTLSRVAAKVYRFQQRLEKGR